jgi:hypothetical protein
MKSKAFIFDSVRFPETRKNKIKKQIGQYTEHGGAPKPAPAGKKKTFHSTSHK